MGGKGTSSVLPHVVIHIIIFPAHKSCAIYSFSVMLHRFPLALCLWCDEDGYVLLMAVELYMISAVAASILGHKFFQVNVLKKLAFLGALETVYFFSFLIF